MNPATSRIPVMAKGERVFLALGSNVGERAAHLARAIARIDATDQTTVVSSSEFFDTAPWGVTDQPRFLNAVVEIRTDLEPDELLQAVKRMEADLGRTATYRWGPRVIDIDLIAYGHRRIELPNLVVPHRDAIERDFVMEPLRQIAPEVAAGLVDGTWAPSVSR
jgi:2-amino-4-hydroxy-6-hydroxymethyldihydropteridine diphosphokinase